MKKRTNMQSSLTLIVEKITSYKRCSCKIVSFVIRIQFVEKWNESKKRQMIPNNGGTIIACAMEIQMKTKHYVEQANDSSQRSMYVISFTYFQSAVPSTAARTHFAPAKITGWFGNGFRFPRMDSNININLFINSLKMVWPHTQTQRTQKYTLPKMVNLSGQIYFAFKTNDYM